MPHQVPASHDAQCIDRTTPSLRQALARVDDEGWDGETGTVLLRFVHDDLVRPLARSLGLEGAALDQACASGWEAAWERLSDPRLVGAGSPWGVVWASVRRAVLGEVVSATYATSARRAWSARRAQLGDEPRLISLAAMADVGWDLAEPARTETPADLGPVLRGIVAALAKAGWDPAAAEAAVVCICDRPIHPLANRAKMRGSHAVAQELGLPLWQVLRLMLLIRGVPGWPGLVERVAVDGTDCLREPDLVDAIRSTVNRRRPSPRVAAAKARAA